MPDPTISISLLIALAGCFVGLGGWLSGRDKKIINDAHWRGSVDAKLDVVVSQGKTLAAIDQKMDSYVERLVCAEASTKQAHKRIDALEQKGA